MPTNDLPSSELTPERVYFDRRTFLTAAGVIGAGLVGAKALKASVLKAATPGQERPLGTPYGLQPTDVATPEEDVTTYNNFYEFGTGRTTRR